jgi:hypothetical protein
MTRAYTESFDNYVDQIQRQSAKFSENLASQNRSGYNRRRNRSLENWRHIILIICMLFCFLNSKIDLTI